MTMNRADFLKAMVGAGLLPSALLDRPQERAKQTPGAPGPPTAGAPFTVTIGGHEIRPYFVHVDQESVDVMTWDAERRATPGKMYFDIEAPREEAEKVMGVYERGEIVEMVARLDPFSTMTADVFVTGLDIPLFPVDAPARVRIEGLGQVTLS